MFQIVFTHRAKRDLKKASFGVQDYIEQTCIVHLSENPYQYGVRLHGIFRNYWKYVFTYKGVYYRVAYHL